MSYYDRIAKPWDALSGATGAPLQAEVTNAAILGRVSDIEDATILELGAGTGYLMPMLLARLPDDVPRRVIITDQSPEMVALARERARIEQARFDVLDVRDPFPYGAASVDLIVANLVFSEVITRGVRNALSQCRRVLRPGGRLVATVLHPAYVDALSRRGALKRIRRGRMIMPGFNNMHIPVVERSLGVYERAMGEAALHYTQTDLMPTPAVLAHLPDEARVTGVPIALCFDCTRPASS